MNLLNILFAVSVYAIAFATAYLLNTKYKINNEIARYESIDGLRGFLALGVFIHHCSIWFQFLHYKSWEGPKSNLFNQLGQTSVSFFFMITAFLFVSKLLNANKKIDWNALFIARFFRLFPMYMVSILLIVLVVFIIGNWEMKVTYLEFLKEMYYWGTFTIFKTTNINDSAYVGIINAGVIWSLPYEWLFYFSLPIISLLLLNKFNSKLYLLISLLFVFSFYKFNYISSHHILSFIGGAITPFIIKYGPSKIKYKSPGFSFVILICLALILYFHSSDNYICKLLIIIIFNLIALGNNVFGVLKNSTLKFLGEISYSTYLIHGIIIFIVMYFGFGFEKAANLSAIQFSITIFIITPLVVITSFVFYKSIEKPSMIYSKRINIEKIKDKIYDVWIKTGYNS